MVVMVEADYANFKIPALKTTGVTYPVPTPSALEGLLKTVIWKKSMRYVIEEIVVFNPINTINITFNNISEKISRKTVKTLSAKKDNAQTVGFYSDVSSHVFSPQVVLKDVKYAIKFRVEMTGAYGDEARPDETPLKYYHMFERRLSNGQTFKAPFLGCREYQVKSFRLLDSIPYDEVSEELKGENDLGYMLYGIKYNDDAPNEDIIPIYYHPIMVDGVIDVSKYRGTCIC